MARKSTHIAVAHRQAGILSLKHAIIIAGGGFMLLMLVVLLATPPKKSAGDQPSQQSTSSSDKSKGSQTSAADKLNQLPATALPAGFKHFANKQYNFSVAFPASWGGLAGETFVDNTVLTARTKEVSEPMGLSQAFGKFTVAIYPTVNFTVTKTEGGSLLKPVEKDGLYEWEVASLAYNERSLQLADKVPVPTVKNANGVVIYDFTWTTSNGRQSRFAFRTQDYIIIMSVPPLSRADKSAPTEAEIKQYNKFATAIINSVTLPVK